MYTIVSADNGSLEDQVRRVVSQRHLQGRKLPEFFLAPGLVDRPPVTIDGFLVMGSRCVAAGELCIVTRLNERPDVRFEVEG